MRILVANLAALLLGVVLLGWATDGFRALTSEQARRTAVATNPVAIPDTQLLFANGESLSLHALVGATPGANTLVGFFYSSCHSICVTLGHDFHQLQNQIVEQGLEQKVKLLTISFDPENDTVPVLQAYQQRMDAKGDLWRIATVPDRESLSALLQTFGIRVIPDTQGGYVHNSAYHIVNSRGELIAITDLGQPQTALRRALEELPQ